MFSGSVVPTDDLRHTQLPRQKSSRLVEDSNHPGLHLGFNYLLRISGAPKVQDFNLDLIWIGVHWISPKGMNFRSLEEFWAFYMNQHSKPSTRRWHFAGTLIGIFFLLCSVLFSWWFLFFALFFGYGLAWYSHFFVEGNAPATFGHPFWSLLCDFKMFGLMLTGNMDKEIKRLGKRPVLQVFWL